MSKNEPSGWAAVAEDRVAEEIGRVLAADDANAQVLRAEIAAVLRQIDAGGTVVRAALEEGNERIRRDVIAAVEILGADFSEMSFLISDMTVAAARIQESLDMQGADIRAIIEQNQQQATDIRLFREDVAVMARRSVTSGQTRLGENGGGLQRAQGCPYRGLLPFEQADADVFYGRERLTAELTATLAGRAGRGGIVVVTGASGAGKSSLLRAGLLPKLAEGEQVAGSRHWPRIIMTPTSSPLTELAARLAALGGGTAMSIRDDLVRDPGQAHLAVRAAVLAEAARCAGQQAAPVPGDPRLVLVIDQFEEVFTLSPGPGGDAERQAFITALRSAAAQPAGTYQRSAAVVVIAVRGDFWDRCAAYTELADALKDGQFVVGPMSESDLGLAITGPADSARLQVDPGLTGTILSDLRAADAGAGVLPLLSHAMALTWENREGDRLTIHGYGLSGGISRAVQVSADEVYDNLTTGQQELARHLFRRMTVASRGGRITRCPVARADLYASHPNGASASVDAVLEAFAARRLIVLDGKIAQICHDILLTAWPRLRGWLEEDQASWILYDQLADDAGAWSEHQGDQSFLYRGTQLGTLRQAVARWSASPGHYPVLTAIQDDFLRTSHRAAARGARRRRGGVTLLALLTVAALIASTFAFQQRTSYLRQRDQAIYNEISAEALQAASTNPSLAAQLTLAAYSLQPTQDLATQLLGTENTPLATSLTTSSTSPISSVVISPDGRTLAAASETNGVIYLWNVTNSANPKRLGQLVTSSSGGISSLVFSPDGGTLVAAGASGSNGGAIWLWDLSTPAHPRILGAPLSPNGKPSNPNDFDFASAVAVSPDGRILASSGAVNNGDNTIQLWDISNRGHPRPLGQLTTNTSISADIESLNFSQNGSTLADSVITDPFDSTVQLWNVSNAAHPRRLASPHDGSNDYFDLAAFSRAGILATAGDSGGIQLWDAANPGNLQPMGHSIAADSNSPSYLAIFSPNGRTLAIVNISGTIQLWNVVNPALPQPLGQSFSGKSNGGVASIAFSPGGHTLISGDDNGTVQLWNIPQTVLDSSSTGGIASMTFSPDGHILADVDRNGSAQLWNLANLAVADPLSQVPAVRNQRVTSLTFSPVGHTIAASQTSGQTDSVQLWNVANPARPEPLGHPLSATTTPGLYSGLTSVAFSPNGHTLAISSGTYSNDNNSLIELWNIDNPVHPQPEGQIMPDDTEASMTFSPDGHILAAIDDIGDIDFWNVTRPSSFSIPLGAANANTGSGPLPALVYSPDGRTLTILDNGGTTELWNVTNPAAPSRVGQLPTITTGLVNSIASSPEGTLVTADADGRIQLWNAANPRHPQSFGQPITASSPFTSVAFSANGTMASGTSTGAIFLWDLHVNDAIRRICKTAGESLTSQNWNHYISQLPYKAPCGQ